MLLHLTEKKVNIYIYVFKDLLEQRKKAQSNVSSASVFRPSPRESLETAAHKYSREFTFNLSS